MVVGVLPAILLWAGSFTATAADVPQFGVFEQALTVSGSYANPYTEVSATGSFNRPSGGTLTVPLFWDGGASWKLRFSPDAIGTWTWSVSSADSGLNGQSGQFSAVASTLKGGIRRRAATPHHFEYQGRHAFVALRGQQFRHDGR